MKKTYCIIRVLYEHVSNVNIFSFICLMKKIHNQKTVYTTEIKYGACDNYDNATAESHCLLPLKNEALFQAKTLSGILKPLG